VRLARRLAPRLRRRLKPLLHWFWRQHGTPGHRARGLAAGVFTGCLPFFGLQIVLGVALAGLMRGNRLLAAAGTWISNPFTTLPMCWLNYQLGVLVIGPGPAWPALHEVDLPLMRQLGWAFSSRLMLGSLLMGLLAAVVSGLLCWRWLLHSERRRAGGQGTGVESGLIS
jgi:uncharacterized protein (DUF2062 family)